MEDVFFREWNIIIPLGDIFSYPRIFGPAVERPGLFPQVSGSSLASFVFLYGFSMTFFFLPVDSLFFFLFFGTHILLPGIFLCVPALFFAE